MHTLGIALPPSWHFRVTTVPSVATATVISVILLLHALTSPQAFQLRGLLGLGQNCDSSAGERSCA